MIKKYNFTIPLIKGAKKVFHINDENGISVAEVKRYYSSRLNAIAEIFLTGWQVNLIATENDKEYILKEHFKWIKNEWAIIENGLEIGTLTDIKKLEFGDSKEICFHGKKYYYLNKPLQTKTEIQDENKNVIAVVNYKQFDLSRKKEIALYSDEIPLSLLVCIDYTSTLKNK